MKKLSMFGLVAVMMLAGGCATAIRGDKQKITIKTEPSGANLLLNGTEKFITPAEIQVKRADTQSFTVSKEGYRTVTFNLSSQWDGLSMTSFILPGGSVLFGIDTASGADKSFNNLATIALQKTTSANEPKLELFEHRGKFYTKLDYDAVVRAEAEDKNRFMGTSSD